MSATSAVGAAAPIEGSREHAETGARPLLALERVALGYGGIQAVKGIDVVVGEGELVCLIGANGAGKTTTLKGICGLLPVKSGTIRYAGQDITGHRAYTLVRRGLALVPEGRGMFGALTIEENLAMGAYARKDRDAVPLVVDETDRIVWVAGFAIDEAFRVTDPAQAVLILRLKAVGGSD